MIEGGTPQGGCRGDRDSPPTVANTTRAVSYLGRPVWQSSGRSTKNPNPNPNPNLFNSGRGSAAHVGALAGAVGSVDCGGPAAGTALAIACRRMLKAWEMDLG